MGIGGGGGAERTEACKGVIDRISSQSQVQAIETDGDTRARHDRAFSRILQQQRIRVVDVGVDAMAARECGEPFETAAAAGDRQMIQFARGPVADAQGDQFVVRPKRAVEEHRVRPCQACEERGIEIAASGDEGAGRAACLFPKHESHRMSHIGASRESGGTCWHRKRLHRKAARGAVTVAKGHGCAQGKIGHGNLTEGPCHRQQAGIAVEYGSDCSCRVYRKVPGLAQQDNAERVIDLCVGHQDAFDRYMSNR